MSHAESCPSGLFAFVLGAVPRCCHPPCCAGTHFPLYQAAEAIQETAKPKRGGKCFIEG